MRTIDIDVEELIEEAKNKYPASIYYTGRLSEEELTVLEKVCDIKCQSVYMNGTATYGIRISKMGDEYENH